MKVKDVESDTDDSMFLLPQCKKSMLKAKHVAAMHTI